MNFMQVRELIQNKQMLLIGRRFANKIAFCQLLISREL
jgi:hypothetical protein